MALGYCEQSLLWYGTIPGIVQYQSFTLASIQRVRTHRSDFLFHACHFACRYNSTEYGMKGLVWYCMVPNHTMPYCTIIVVVFVCGTYDVPRPRA